jgi:hypothetical protein
MSTHFEYTKNANGLFVCPHCAETKRLQSTMHYHMKKHLGKLPFECHHCQKGFLHQSTLDLHIKAQHQKDEDRAFKCPCAGCPYKGTLTKANLMIHYVRKHCGAEAAAAADGDKKTPTCKACGKGFNSPTAYHYHVAGCLRLDPVRQGHLNTFLGVSPSQP